MASGTEPAPRAGRRLRLPGYAIAAALAAGALYYAGTGLHPIAWLVWFAPLPVLVLAPRVPAVAAAGAAFVAWLLGEANLATYLIRDVEIPVGLAVGLFLGLALLFAGVVLLFRVLVRRGHLFGAALVVPASWAFAEYLFATTSPDGAFWSLAYTQSDVAVVRQLASVTGYVGITFVLMAVPSAVAACLAPGAVRRAVRVRAVAAAAAVLALVVGFGLARPVPDRNAGSTLRVALVAVRQDGGRADITTPDGRQLVDGYVQEIRRVATAGAQVVVAPEAVFRADDTSITVISAPLQQIADDTGATIVLGVGYLDPALGTMHGKDAGYNTAQVYAPRTAGRAYRKQHLIVTEPYEPGDTLLTGDLAGGVRFGVEICKDLDFPALARATRQAGADVLLVPAWDFDRDAWLHSRMAVMRGIENGLPVVRTARSGALTVSDASGAVLAEGRTGSAPVVTVTADLPVRTVDTLYTRLGDWFAWLCIVLMLGAFAPLVFRRRRAVRPGGRPETVDRPLVAVDR
jgi:apolipoprotein N-acyltransferase